ADGASAPFDACLPARDRLRRSPAEDAKRQDPAFHSARQPSTLKGRFHTPRVKDRLACGLPRASNGVRSSFNLSHAGDRLRQDSSVPATDSRTALSTSPDPYG